MTAVLPSPDDLTRLAAKCFAACETAVDDGDHVQAGAFGRLFVVFARSAGRASPEGPTPGSGAPPSDSAPPDTPPPPAWDDIAHDPQKPPAGDAWRTWVLLGGRGSGKTRAGAEWIAGLAEGTPGVRLGLIAPTLHDAREVMLDGPSGLLNLPGRVRPRYEPSKRRLSWPNGSVAHLFSAEDPDSLRGPQFDFAWADEFCAWARPGKLLPLLRMSLRLGERPRLLITTTPRPTATLRALLAEPGCVRADAPTALNAANLAPAFLDDLHGLYGGTRLAAQELEGRIVEAGGALWRAEDLARCRGGPPAAPFERIVVAVDPPATAHGDACGIVVAGRREGRAYILADRTERGLSPGGWGRAVRDAAAEWGAGRIVAEANMGGDMVRHVLSVADPACPVRLVHASKAKRARAEPVAALYEQGRIIHCAAMPALEEELMALGGEDDGGGASPDRADALVWAVTDLLLEGRTAVRPSVRVL